MQRIHYTCKWTFKHPELQAPKSKKFSEISEESLGWDAVEKFL
jgi:hypothetical protein